MHGRAGSPEEFVGLEDMLDERPSLRGRFRLILPLAEEIMITKFQTPMHAWFDCRADRWDVDEDVEGYERSLKRIENLIQHEIQQGIKPERIFVAGYSQGGAMAYLAALRSSVPLGGAVSLSGWCPLLQDLQKATGSSADRLHFLTYQTLTHTTSVTEMKDVMTFIENCIAGNSSHPQQSSLRG
ncbi:hypothetical protein Esti_001415 [Eimeria stiedai]